MPFAVIAPAVVACGLACAKGVTAPLFLQNVTPSMPLGLYQRVDAPVRTGVIVALRQPTIAKGYLRLLGFPADALLLKRVTADGQSIACAREDWMWTTGGLRLPRLAIDHRGKRLPRWSGCRSLGAADVVVTGDDPRSFDSRYFGPVARSAIVGVYRRLP